MAPQLSAIPRSTSIVSRHPSTQRHLQNLASITEVIGIVHLLPRQLAVSV